jgi:hypothetical protein
MAYISNANNTRININPKGGIYLGIMALAMVKLAP